MLTFEQFSTTEVLKLQDQLKEIDTKRVDGKFLTATGEVAAANDENVDLLNRCLMWSDIVLSRLVLELDDLFYHILIVIRKGEFPEAFLPTYTTLVEIRNKLEKLSLTQAWSLRETDLYDYQRQLDRIDESRVDHNFVDAEGNFAELYVQRVCCSGPFSCASMLTFPRHCFT
jgi:hypothetical protein